MEIVSENPDVIMSEVNAEISALMNTEIAEAAKDALVKSTFDNVYGKYSSGAAHPYVRRYTAGGIADKNLYELTEDGGGSDYHEIIIKDERPEVSYIERGVYNWIRSAIFWMQPYPRPYFEPADISFLSELESRIQALMNVL